MEQLLEPAAPAAGRVALDGPQRIKFHASGSEYFRIWIVNLLLTIATLGIYSAWAKVRRNQYMYSCTELAGASFEYHGRPMAILKGRIIALVLIGGYNLALRVSPLAGLVMFVLLAAVMPWLVWNSLKFRLFYTSYRGIRFGFGGSTKAAYFHFLVLPLLYVVTLTLALPFVHQRIKRFQHTESRYGTQHFGFDATVGSFYKRYGILLALIAGGGVLSAVVGALLRGAGQPAPVTIVASIAVGYVWLFLLIPLFMNMIQNLIWNHTSLGVHRFSSDMKWGKVVAITLTNVLAIVVTLGLFTPFAVVRWQRYHLESIALLPGGSLDEFVSGQDDAVSATGIGATDMLDFDLSM
ncbi:YjgN family protein [Duganella margarita]|uniref:YjgN family protein n=1 Tax=Duganella margarita TaxID=2692170 RepID=UPI001E4FD076|nr:YjgN family protein [Duganella margarita]